jgi:hypothetical protein
MSGLKVFEAFEILTAADVNSYLMEQSVMVFGGTAARDAAIGTATGAVEPNEGMLVYLTDLNQYQMNLDGTVSGWFPVAGQMPRYHIKLNSAFSITSGSTLTVTGWTEISNRGGFSGTAGVITVPITGRYNITFMCIHTANNTTGGRGALITLSSTGVVLRNTHPAPQSAAHSQAIPMNMTSVSLTAEDTITLQAYQNSGPTNTLTTDTFCIVEYVGP